MIKISLDLSKDYLRPIIKINQIDALIDTGATIPVISLPAPVVELAFNATKILDNAKISGFGGDCKGKVYEIEEFKIGELSYKPFQFFIPDKMITKHPFLLSATMFYGTDYEFDTINNKFIINVPDEEKLKRSFYLKDLHGKLYAQINEVLLQEVDNNIIEEYDNYYQEELDR